MPEESREADGRRRVLVSGDDICGVTDIGCSREQNEDALFLDAATGLIAVADGLGGLPAGEVASRTAVEASRAFLAGRLCPTASDSDAREALWGAFDAAQTAVLEESGRPGNRGMATTLVVAWICGRRLYCSHVGDVRAYLLRGDSAECLTTDHTVAFEMVAAGRLPASLLRDVPERNLLTRVIGLRGNETPSFADRNLAAGDVVLLCSDGLWEPVTDEELGRAREALVRDPRSGTVALVDLAVGRGGRDNITAVAARIR